MSTYRREKHRVSILVLEFIQFLVVHSLVAIIFCIFKRLFHDRRGPTRLDNVPIHQSPSLQSLVLLLGYNELEHIINDLFGEMQSLEELNLCTWSKRSICDLVFGFCVCARLSCCEVGCDSLVSFGPDLFLDFLFHSTQSSHGRSTFGIRKMSQFENSKSWYVVCSSPFCIRCSRDPLGITSKVQSNSRVLLLIGCLTVSPTCFANRSKPTQKSSNPQPNRPRA
jgi:hypothetical protein